MAEERDIKYINKSFSDFKTQLMEYAKNYFPDAYLYSGPKLMQLAGMFILKSIRRPARSA